MVQLGVNPGHPFPTSPVTAEQEFSERGKTVRLSGRETGAWGTRSIWKWTQVESHGSNVELNQVNLTADPDDRSAATFMAPDKDGDLYFMATVRPAISNAGEFEQTRIWKTVTVGNTMASLADARGGEHEGVTFTVTLASPPGEVVRARWTASIEDGDTANTIDFTPTRTGTVTIEADKRTGTFTVPLENDERHERDQTFTVIVKEFSNGMDVGAGLKATGTIVDDDTVLPAAPGNSVVRHAVPDEALHRLHGVQQRLRRGRMHLEETT